ncbi:MotA/TolQ/ExbB proton channel family protein [Puniceicoccus vermicola]|uniref:MotA/TolQ/ExbB proton channel family protein n=1 Tax=Puniceicoccus vermicola TaxID=388746 RepID=A0A7X1AYC9_9BACT|nr:MotA/TolQ/ExbB proton channel family protein [Puniceicoccus vermicola]MBC2602251.1 MotA/TolQ/ExbB proton channel family protein [Puniceicoccus vermicola]
MEFLNFTLFQQGGPVMWPLLIISVFGFIFFVERTLFLHQGQIQVRTFVDGIQNLLRKGRLAEALAVCEETPGPIPNVVKAALLNYDAPISRIRGAIQSAALIEIPILERRIGTIAAIARIAPILGLLGTILAGYDAFFIFQNEGAYANPSDFAGAISQALLTTIAGLAIAAMAHLAHHFLHGRLRAVVHDMESVGHDLLQWIENMKNTPPEESPEREEKA